MKRGFICIFLGIILASIMCASALSGGGTSSNPYKITNCNELQQISSNYYVFYELSNDIDCANQDFTPIGECYYDFQPHLTGCDFFYGSLDGKNHKITNLHISKEIQGGAVALFGAISGDSVIKNLILENVEIENVNHINAGNSFAAGLVGINFGGTISNCHVSGTVSNREFNGKYKGYAGGITAFNTFFEENKIGKIENSNFNGEVYGDNVGGLVGINNGNIYSSYTSGTVTSQGSNGAGGLVGSNRGLISNCYSKSYITGDYDSGQFGGLVGENYHADNSNIDSGKIINSYSTGNVKETYSGNNYKASIGGLAGTNLPGINIEGSIGLIENSFSSSSVKCDASSCGYLTTANAGGLLCNYEIIGSNNAGVVNSYWSDVEDDNAIYCIRYGIDTGCRNATINQLKGNVKNNQPFVNWDFTNVWVEVANDYPKLKWEVGEVNNLECTSSGGTCEWIPCGSGSESLGQKDCGILHSCCKLIPIEETCGYADGTCRTSCLSTENNIGIKYCSSGKTCCKESLIISGCTTSDPCWLKNSHCTASCTCEAGYSADENGGCVTSTVYTCVSPYVCESACEANKEQKEGFSCETGICCGEKAIIPCGDGICDSATETWLTCSTDCPKPCEEYTAQPACEADTKYAKDLGYTPENPIINNGVCSKKKTEECKWLINKCILISGENPDRINDEEDCGGIISCKWQPNYQGNCNSGNFVTISYIPIEGCTESKDDIKISCAAKLPFFTWLNILLIIGALIVFYIIFKAGKKRKSSKKKI